MADSDPIDEKFTAAVNEALKLFDQDQLEECEIKAREILDDRACPGYHRMKTLILLGSILGDWDEANTCRIYAHSLWVIARRHWPEGKDARIEQALEEVRGLIQDLGGVLAEEVPREEDFTRADDEVVAKHDANVEETREWMDNLDLEEYPERPAITVEVPEKDKMEVDKQPAPALKDLRFVMTPHS